jgi:hypothetical protein
MAFPEFEHPGHQVAVRHKLAFREYLADLARQAKLRDPDTLAAQLALLVDGAWIAARVFPRDDQAAMNVSPAAKALIEARTGESRGRAREKKCSLISEARHRAVGRSDLLPARSERYQFSDRRPAAKAHRPIPGTATRQLLPSPAVGRVADAR